MKKMILVFMMVAVSAVLSNCSSNSCCGTCVSECSGSNSYTGNWY